MPALSRLVFAAALLLAGCAPAPLLLPPAPPALATSPLLNDTDYVIRRIALGAGKLYVAATSFTGQPSGIYRLDGGRMELLAGDVLPRSPIFPKDGQGAGARFNMSPVSLVADGLGHVFLLDRSNAGNQIRRVDAAGNVTTLPMGDAQSVYTQDIACDVAGTLYVLQYERDKGGKLVKLPLEGARQELRTDPADAAEERLIYAKDGRLLVLNAELPWKLAELDPATGARQVTQLVAAPGDAVAAALVEAPASGLSLYDDAVAPLPDGRILLALRPQDTTTRPYGSLDLVTISRDGEVRSLPQTLQVEGMQTALEFGPDGLGYVASWSALSTFKLP